MSIKMSSGRSWRANASPASASVAVSTVCPTDFNRKIANVMLVAMSSTTRTLAISADQLATGHGSPHVGRDALAVEFGLFDDGRHVAIEPDSIVGGDLLGGDHHDGNAGGVGLRVERLHH